MTILGREPVRILTAVNALLALAVGFGLNMTSAQQALIHAAVSALLGVLIRREVTPVITAEEHIDTAVRLAQLGRLPPYDDIP